jgi:hypothetical protein
MAFEVPVLLIVFNRPDVIAEVMATLRKVRPRRLFIAADAPRPNIETDAELCRRSREIASNPDWGVRSHHPLSKGKSGSGPWPGYRPVLVFRAGRGGDHPGRRLFASPVGARENGIRRTSSGLAFICVLNLSLDAKTDTRENFFLLFRLKNSVRRPNRLRHQSKLEKGIGNLLLVRDRCPAHWLRFIAGFA